MMRYFEYRLDDGVPRSLFRVDLDADPIVLERWSPETKTWEWEPIAFDAVAGLASDEQNYHEVDNPDPSRLRPMKQEADQERKSPSEASPRFLLRTHYWRGQTVVRALPVIHYDLVFEDERGRVRQFVFEGGRNPVDRSRAGETGIAATLAAIGSGNTPPGGDSPRAWLAPGKRWELPPGHSENPTKELPVFMDAVDAGAMQVLEDSDLVWKARLDGRKLHGVFIATRTSPSDEVWTFRRSDGPGGDIGVK